MRTLIAVLALVVLTACSSPTGPTVPPEAEEVEPLPVYAEWYAEMEECAEIEGDFEGVRWFVVQGVLGWRGEGGKLVRGLWRSDHRIYLGEFSANDRDVVTHEILHDLLEANAHPEPPFGGYCAPSP